MPPTFVIADLWAQQAHHHVPRADQPIGLRAAGTARRVAGIVRRPSRRAAERRHLGSLG